MCIGLKSFDNKLCEELIKCFYIITFFLQICFKLYLSTCLKHKFESKHLSNSLPIFVGTIKYIWLCLQGRIRVWNSAQVKLEGKIWQCKCTLTQSSYAHHFTILYLTWFVIDSVTWPKKWHKILTVKCRNFTFCFDIWLDILNCFISWRFIKQLRNFTLFWYMTRYIKLFHFLRIYKTITLHINALILLNFNNHLIALNKSCKK